MATAVQSREETVVKDDEKGWTTQPVHGNSKRQCMIQREKMPCGAKAVLVTAAADGRNQRRVSRLLGGPIYHCDHPRHIANAHKQITDILKQD